MVEDLESVIEIHIQNLERAILNQEKERIDRTVSSLERRLLHNESYKQIGNERSLSKAVHLLSRVYGEENRDQLNPLIHWLKIIRDVNDKFYAILNHRIALDDLLYSKLVSWKYFGEDLIYDVEEEIRQQLRAAREESNFVIKIQSFMSLYLNFLKQHKPNLELQELERIVQLVMENFKRLSNKWNVYALFSLRDGGDVYGIRIKATAANGETGSIDGMDEIDYEMKKAAKGCFEFIKTRYQPTTQWDIRWEIERAISFEGNSVGLALTLGILTQIEGLEIDPFTVFTGKVEWNTGKITAVGDLDIKLNAAKELGIRRVFIPSENQFSIPDILDLDIVPVSSVDEAITQLSEKSYVSASSTLEKQAEIKLKELEIKLSSQGIKVVGGVQSEKNYKRLKFTDYQDEIFVNLYFGRNGITPSVQPKNCRLRNTVQAVCDQIFGKEENELPNDVKRFKKYVVSDKELQHRIENHIFTLPYSIREVEQNCLYRAKISKNGHTVFVRQFNNGTLTIDGREPIFSEINNQIEAILGFSALSTDADETKLEKQIEAVMAVNLGNQWIGTDEAGKGDYFGPLVGAAVLVNNNLADQLAKIGVKDSKKISDNRNRELAGKIMAICGKRARVVLVPPARYNQLYEQFKAEGKNLNTLLAWIHTRALEDILTIFPQDQITVIIDKFADEQYIKNKLLENTRRTNLNLVQLPKAEANIAVAAASILARSQFLNWLERTSLELKTSLPKGSSDPKIAEVARQIIQKYGQEKLAEVAKLHFKTTQNILSS